MNTNELLNVIEATLPSVTWTKQTDPGRNRDGTIPDAESYSGRSESGWMFTVVVYALDVEGFPRARGYDGAAVKRGVIVHLTPELAKKAIELAEATHLIFF